MSKTASSSLHELIKSLTKSEKRYFKIYASRHTIGEKNNYLELFDYIASKKVYDEQTLFDHFKGQAFLNRFSITKNRLYESIIRSLDAYHSTHSAEAQLYKQLHASSLLFRKGLYQQSLKILRSARKLAEKNDCTIILMQINEKLKKLNESCGKKCFDQDAIQIIYERDIAYGDTISYNNTLWRTKGKLFALIEKNGRSRSEEARKQFDLAVQEMKDSKFLGNKTFDTIYLENLIWSTYYFGVLEDRKSLNYLKENLILFESTKDRITEEPNKYFSILSRIIQVECNINNYRSAFTHLKKLKSFPKTYKFENSVDFEIKLFSIISSTEMMLYLKQGDFDKSIALENTIIEGLEKHKENIPPNTRASLYFQMAVAFFGKEDFSKSLKWLNKLFNDHAIDDKVNIIAFSHLLNLIVHLEMANFRLLPYALQRAKRYLNSRNRNFKFEELFLDYIKRFTKMESRFDEEILLKEVLAEIHKLKEDPYEKVALNYFDFESWVLARLKQKKYARVHKESYLATIQH
jgi:hypothetical protein